MQLQMERLVVEEDLAMMIDWLQKEQRTETTHPLLRVTYHQLQDTPQSIFRHIYRETNSVID